MGDRRKDFLGEERSVIACTFCGTDAPEIARQTLLGRHDVAYHCCPGCDLIFTESAYWLEEAYEAAISDIHEQQPGTPSALGI